jgi:glycosyltransferase involved in cell wall biosynthesis
MRILAITSKFSGVGYHRLMLPLVHMQKEYCLITDTLTEELISKDFDILVVNRFLANIELNTILEWRKKYNFKLIVDNDDYWSLETHHVLYSRYEQNGITEKILKYIQEADLCTCTHERLAEEIYKYNTNVHILPNALPYGDEQFGEQRIPSDKVRLFWSGSGTHEKDIKLISQPFKRLTNLPVKMVISGYNETEGEVWNNMVYYYSAGRKLDLQIYRYNEVTRYMEAYADSDIGIIPLEENRFNAMKSNLKVLECAAKKIPCIVSNVNPYKGLPVLYVNKQTDWYKNIKELVNNKQTREELGNKLYEYCSKVYNFKEINSKRYDIYKQICQ